MSLAIDDIADVHIGQVVPSRRRRGHTIAGSTVVTIAAQPDADSSPTTYRVTSPSAVTPVPSLGTLSTTATDALAVPSSAVSTVGGRHVVRVVDGSTVTETQGRGRRRRRHVDRHHGGLTAGQQVVVAHFGEPLPSSATSATQATSRAVQRTFGGGFACSA